MSDEFALNKVLKASPCRAPNAGRVPSASELAEIEDEMRKFPF